MKAIQITVDEELLAELEAAEEVRERGRSAVFRQAVREYLRRSRRAAIESQYRQAYGTKPGVGNEFEGWEDEGEWPND